MIYKNNVRNKLISLCIFMFILVACYSNSLAYVALPIYSGGYSIAKDNNESFFKNHVFYKINIKFPAPEVISFYEKYFDKLNYKPYKDDGYGLSQWEHFNYSSGEWERSDDIPARFISSWVDSDKKYRIILVLMYKYNGVDKKWKRTLLVDCKMVPFFDFNSPVDIMKDHLHNHQALDKLKRTKNPLTYGGQKK